MVDERRKMVYFPHHIFGNVLNGETLYSSAIDGGILKVEKLGLDRNKLFGGNVEIMGKINRYGIYACIYYASREGRLIGFWINRWDDLTEEGRKVVREFMDVHYHGYTLIEGEALPPEEKSPEQLVEERKVLEEARAKGIPETEIAKKSASGLQNIIAARDSGKSTITVPMESVAMEKPAQKKVKVVRRGPLTT